MKLLDVLGLLTTWLLLDFLPGTLCATTNSTASGLNATHILHKPAANSTSPLTSNAQNPSPNRGEGAGVGEIAKECLNDLADFIRDADFGASGSDGNKSREVANEILKAIAEEVESANLDDSLLSRRGLDVPAQVKSLFRSGLKKGMQKVGSMCVTNMAVDVGFAVGSAVAQRISNFFKTKSPEEKEEETINGVLVAFQKAILSTDYNALLSQLSPNRKLKKIDLNRAARKGFKSYQARIDRTFLGRLPRPKLEPGQSLAKHLTQNAMTKMTCAVESHIVDEASGVVMGEAQKLAGGLVEYLSSQAFQAAISSGLELDMTNSHLA